MNRFLIPVILIFVVSMSLMASPNLRIDGGESVVVDPPQEIEVSAEFSEPGGTLIFRLFMDKNGNRNPEPNEFRRYLKIIDGVPPLGNLDGDFIEGDLDSIADGEMHFTTIIDMSAPITPVPLDTVYFFLTAQDATDGSADTAIIKVLPPEVIDEPDVPYIYGNVYSAVDSTDAVYPALLVLRGSTFSDTMATDSDGRFFSTVPSRDSTYMILVVPLDGDHISSSAMVSIGASNDSIRQNIYCNGIEQHIRGNITLDGETPVPGGFIMLGFNTTGGSIGASIHDPATGEYRIPAFPGETQVGFLDFESFPSGYFPYPVSVDIVVPASGDVEDVDFDLMPLDAAISGVVIDSSLAGDAENEGIWIFADGGSFGDYSARTDSEGNFIIPVKGTDEETYKLTIETYGFDVNPWEFDDIEVGVGDTVTGFNFILGEAWIDNEISGIVTDIDGDPVDSAIVIALNPELSFKRAWQMAWTDTSGIYSFENLPPWVGKWFVGAYKDSMGETTPDLIVINTLRSDTSITSADFVFSLSGILEGIPLRAGAFEISNIFPNPFNSRATAVVQIEDALETAEIAVFDILGRQRTRIHSGPIPAGNHKFELNCGELASGVYFLRLTAPGICASREFVFIK